MSQPSNEDTDVKRLWINRGEYNSQSNKGCCFTINKGKICNAPLFTAEMCGFHITRVARRLAAM